MVDKLDYYLVVSKVYYLDENWDEYLAVETVELMAVYLVDYLVG